MGRLATEGKRLGHQVLCTQWRKQEQLPYMRLVDDLAYPQMVPAGARELNATGRIPLILIYVALQIKGESGTRSFLMFGPVKEAEHTDVLRWTFCSF